jgi:transposase
VCVWGGRPPGMHAGSSGYWQSLGFELWIGDPAEIKTKRVRKQKTDREDARLLPRLLRGNRFPRIWVPSPENRDLRQLLWQRHRLVGRTVILRASRGRRCSRSKKTNKTTLRREGRGALKKELTGPTFLEMSGYAD